MTVRTTQFAFMPLNVGATAYTVPSGHTALLKSIVCRNNSAATAEFRVGNGNSGGVGQLFKRSLAAGDTTRDDVWLVFLPGEQIKVAANPASSQCEISLHGALLYGVADLTP